MGFAAFGWLTPVAGALTQEAIDVAVILNALRALGARPRPAARGHAAGDGHARSGRSTSSSMRASTGCARSPTRWTMPSPRLRWR